MTSDHKVDESHVVIARLEGEISTLRAKIELQQQMLMMRERDIQDLRQQLKTIYDFSAEYYRKGYGTGGHRYGSPL